MENMLLELLNEQHVGNVVNNDSSTNMRSSDVTFFRRINEYEVKFVLRKKKIGIALGPVGMPI